jgi:hypothetical protein
VYVAWEDSTLGSGEIFYRRSTDGGATFGSTVNLSNNAAESAPAAVAVSGNNVYVDWRDNTPGNFDIFYRRSTDGGASFGSTVNLSNNAGDSGGISQGIAASGSNVYIVWFDNTPGNFEIFLRKSVNSGDIFGSTVNYSHSTGDSIAPTIAVSPNNY